VNRRLSTYFSILTSNWIFMIFPLMPFMGGCISFHRGPMTGEPTASYAQIQGARIRYVDTAEQAPAEAKKPVAVMVHGFASAIEAWTDVIPEVRKTHRVVALDLKGFGWSDRPEGDYSPQAQARIVFALLEKLGIERASWIAHSWGSSIALAAAIMQPAKVRRLALYDAWVYEEQLPVFFQWARASVVGESMFASFYKQRTEDRLLLAFHDRKYVSEPLLEAVEAALERPGTVAAALAAVRGQRFAEMQSKYKSVTQPALLLWGREDRVATASYGERLARDLPKARLVTYPLCGHFPMIEAKEASNRDLVAFLASDLSDADNASPVKRAVDSTEAQDSP
jgi:pimeloyl-ACP methyl ester carboxylesterase